MCSPNGVANMMKEAQHENWAVEVECPYRKVWWTKFFPTCAMPAKAGTHASIIATAERWVSAFAAMAEWS
jgi:hypothetical protein